MKVRAELFLLHFSSCGNLGFFVLFLEAIRNCHVLV